MKYIKVLLILFLIINICFLFYVLFGIQPIHTWTYEEYRISQEGENPELEAELKIRIYPINKDIIETNYKGNMNNNYFYEKLYDFVHGNLEKLQDELSATNDLENYFSSNIVELKAIAGITTVQELEKLKNNILNFDVSDDGYINAEVVEDSYVSLEKYDYFTLQLNYKDNCYLTFKIYLANDLLTSPMVIIESIGGGVNNG